jgi:protein-L-isoaspartate(D-aspartate) O-methyltransferase
MTVMLEQLGLLPGHRVLEIGTGSGYNAALLAHLVGPTGEVVTVDIDEELARQARKHVVEAGFPNVKVICADGGYGYADDAPYDRIILTVGAADVLPAWKEQLAPDGRLVLPLSITWSERSIAFTPDDDHLTSLSVGNCSFMRLRGDFPGMNWQQLGPEPGLLLGCHEDFGVDADAVYAWLTGPFKDWKTGIDATLGEVVFGLELWVSLHKSEVRHVLAAQGDMVDRNLVPPLVLGSNPDTVTTGVLIGEQGMVALMRPSDQRNPFSLILRQFGHDDTLVHQLLEQIKNWDSAGRPGTKGLRIRAYSKDAGYSVRNGEFVVEKPCSTLVIDWPAPHDIHS